MMASRVLRAGLVLSALVLCACPPQKTAQTTPTTAGSNPPPAAWRTGRLEVMAEVEDLDDALIKGDVARYLNHFSPDPSSLMLGSAPNELYLGPQAFADTIKSSLSRGGILVRQSDVATYMAQDGSAAWAYVEFDVMVNQNGQISALPMRMSLVFERGPDGSLKIAGGHTSVAVKNDDLFSRAAAGMLAQPAPMIERIGPNANDLYQTVQALQAGGFDAERRLTATDPGVLIVGTAPGERWTGADFAAEPRPSGQPELKPTYSQAHVWESGRGTFGFATYNVTLTGDNAGKPVTITTRVTEVYEKRPDGWKRVHAQSSVPILPADLGSFMVQR